MEPFIKLDDLYIIGRYHEFKLTDSNNNLLALFKIKSGFGISPIRDILINEDGVWIKVATFESNKLTEPEFLKHYLYQIEHPYVQRILRDNKINSIIE